MNSVIAKIADSIIRYRIALLTLYILFSLFYTLKNHLLLLSPTIYNSVTNLFAQDLVLSEHGKAFHWIACVTVFANRSTKVSILHRKKK